MRVAVVIPCFRVRRHIGAVLAAIGPDVSSIYVVDDHCPEQTGAFVRESCRDPRVRVLTLDVNQGVGGATLAGIAAAVRDGADICVKIDGDGQMDPALIGAFIRPIVQGQADYVKGNRFYRLDDVGSMPAVRIFGNAALSFLSKLSTGYWDIFDPTNGYFAIHAAVVRELPLDRISRRYFFESDLLYHLALLRARVLDVPMRARYGDETSGLRVGAIIPEFLAGHLRNFLKRVLYSYFLRNFSIASVYLLCGLVLLLSGGLFGAVTWYVDASRGVFASTGTVMLAVLPIILGFQLLLAFLSHDMAGVPTTPLHPRLPWPQKGNPPSGDQPPPQRMTPDAL
ncbi:MAG: glycosyltransferase family 2 protein [Telmatospirillum sp.]|nr:glycosyltransferase family 2 protein [Telmatospirillum sp.]